MNSYVNTGLGALLGTVFVLMTVSIASEGIFSSEAPENPGFVIAAAEGGESAGAEEAAPAETPIADLLASADAAKGESIFKKCAACHTGENGGANKVGPNLWNIVNRPVASHEGFGYSSAMQEFSKGGSETWTFDNLYHFLKKPKDFVSGTAMGFAGLKKEGDRADLIAYLRTLSDSPADLPSADAAPAAEMPATDAPAAEAPAADAPAVEAPAAAN